MSKKFYEATLKYGESYTLGLTTFLRGKPQVVSEAVKEKLERSAIDRLTLVQNEHEKEAMIRQKFVFKAAVAPDSTKEERFADMAAVADAQGDADFDDDESDADTADSAHEDAEAEEVAVQEADKKPAGRGKRK